MLCSERIDSTSGQHSANASMDVAAKLFSKLIVEYRPAASLAPYANNARTHSRPQVRKLMRSIETFGFVNPVLINRDNMIIAGHGRVEAAKLLGMAEIPTIRLGNLTEDQVRALILADNKIALDAGWNPELLRVELQYLLTVEDTIDISLTGFEIPEIDLIIGDSKPKEDPADDLNGLGSGPSVTQTGDLWQLGQHRILCGNSLEGASYTRLLGKQKADLVVADLPYNVPISGHATGNGAIQHREFAMASGEMSESEFTDFLTICLNHLACHSKDGSVHFLFMDFHHMGALLKAGNQVYDSLLNLCVWTKNNGGMGSLYRSQHELVFVFRNGKKTHRNNVQLGKFGRNRTNVWAYPNVGTFSKQGDEGNLLALHPTVKPVALIADAILDCSARGDLVVDSFLGSGSTLLAAERVGRRCAGIEIDPLYVNVAIRRWQRQTGEDAVHTVSGKTFHQIAEEREAAGE
jgi:DNA modification methylase